MAGARIPFSGWAPIAEKDSVFRLLEVSVSGTIIQEFFRPRGTNVQEQGLAELLDSLDGAFTQPSQNVMPMDDTPDDRPTCAYEARVLEGIWAAAPYLHNGSVPTLEELLKPASERLATFEVGPNYDIESVGLAAEQTRFDYTLETTGCDDPASGNSRCGHEYGTMLSPEKKRALLEYLKFL
jgi:hypothetical protein